jgi:molecular chaperone DnaJ
MAAKRDYYEVLGVKRDASADEIKKAYKKLALANHPDRNPGDQAAVDRFKEAAEAFEVLSDPDRRARYDRFGHEGVKGAGHAGAGFQDIGDIFEMFGDLFEGFGFGGGRRRGGRGGPRATQGDHLKASLTIDLLEAAKGCSREIEIKRRELCGTCHGSGAKAGSAPATCDYCNGHGQVVQSQGFFRIQTTCPACRGEGKIVRDKCVDCGGAGRKVEKVRLTARIPPGVDTGMSLCLRGEGEPGTNGGPRGDLYVEIHVKEHHLFERDGQDLICRVPITYAQAVLGADIEVPTLDGRQRQEIPPGTQSGEVFRIRGGGMPDPRGGRAGDLLVEVHIEVPKKISDEQRDLLIQLAELEKKNISQHRESFFDKVKDWFTGDGR